MRLKEEWIMRNGNNTEKRMPEFEYYDFENWLLINYYYVMTSSCQGEYSYQIMLLKYHNNNLIEFTGFSFLMCCALYVMPSYKKWPVILIFLVHISCMPVDILIFYKEPLGPIGTLAAMVLGFLPFMMIIGKYFKTN